jgi:hypothetical protein
MKLTIYISDKVVEKVNNFCETNGFKKSVVFVRGAEKFMDSFYSGEVGDPYQVKAINIPKIKKIQESKSLDVCKHGQMKGLCKYGC